MATQSVRERSTATRMGGGAGLQWTKTFIENTLKVFSIECFINLNRRNTMERKINTKLQHAIIDSGNRQFRIAQETGIHFTRLSQIINGWTVPNEKERIKLADYFNKSVKELFDESL